MQTWPMFRNFVRAVWRAATSMSASSKIRIGALPPSSNDTFLSPQPASRAMIRPTSVEPVRLTFRTAGWDTSKGPS